MSAEGDLIFYDFGMMCETAKSKDDLVDVFFGIYEKDTNKACVDGDGITGLTVHVAESLATWGKHPGAGLIQIPASVSLRRKPDLHDIHGIRSTLRFPSRLLTFPMGWPPSSAAA